MKILLVEPAKPEKAVGGEDFAIFEPLALEYLAAGIDEKHDVRILDMRLDKDLDNVLNNFVPDVVGITGYTVHVNTIKRLLTKIKEFDDQIYTVVGGHHATVMPHDFYEPFVDIVVMGEGVDIFRDIIEHLESNTALNDLRGAEFAEGGKGTIVINNKEDIDLDSMPTPRRELTSQYRNSYFSEWMKPLASIRTSKGCHYRCRFCALWKLTGGRYITRNPASIIDELKTITEEYIFFADDESMLDTKRMDKLADMIKESGIMKRYFVYGRSDTIVSHPELIEKWKGIGLERVFVGLEFFRDSDLKNIKKGSTVANNVKAVQILKDLELDIFPNFIVRQDFGKKDFRQFREFCLNLDLDFVGFSVLTPLPGTELYEEQKDKFISSEYDHFDFFHTILPTRMPLKDFYKELITLFNRSRSFKNQMKFIRKYPLREIPSLFKLHGKFIGRLKVLADDYPI
ncbi:MAG: B12-binding domain-containing radical SAM protein [Nitrospirota bacterium]|nr:B12-binding domain-containing radical SAM protein [Nitrospirota bacterium]